MEKQLTDISNEAINHKSIAGFQCIDSNGLCLTASGLADERTSGSIVAIAKLAQKLDPNNSVVVCVESVNSKILIKQNNHLTTALYTKH
ncbi:ragulator complex protein LAMTOR5 homolog [Oppia nitens]|uniref:ragulator complex protein LAMTOR5 homolog n=1 Tax=Oppia nitens TaxID=1686743 RepID=UPI0023DC3191|nr:ragulator complex protein LAMTOR5 homolog [Oppia nitens]